MKRNKAWRLILIILGLTCALLILEALCSAYMFFKNSTSDMEVSRNPRLGVEPKRNITYVNNFGMIRKLNSTGFEGPELSEINDSYFKIIFMGDSVVEEGYLPQDQRLPVLLQNKIIKNTLRNVVVWNAGVGGYNSKQTLEFLKDNAFKYHPDLIIVGICQNDFVENMPRAHNFLGRIFLTMRDGSKARVFNWLYQRSDLYKCAYDRLSDLYRFRITKDGYAKYLKNYRLDISEKEWTSWKECIKEIALSANNNGVNIVFVIFPLHSQVVQNNDGILQKLNEFFVKEGYDFINLTNSFKFANDRGIILYRKYDIIHFNRNGTEIAADDISNYLRENKKYLYKE